MGEGREDTKEGGHLGKWRVRKDDVTGPGRLYTCLWRNLGCSVLSLHSNFQSKADQKLSECD